MAIYVCKRLISLSFNSSSYIYRPSISISFSLFSSTSTSTTTKRKPPIPPIPVGDYLVQKHHFSPEVASKLSLLVKGLKSPENTDSVLSFLKQSGFSQTHIEFVTQRVPRILSSKLEITIIPKFKVFLDMGFSPTDVVEIIMTDPWILTRSADNRIGPSILLLRSVFGSNEDVTRVLKRFGRLLVVDLGKTMIPNIEYMESCGITKAQIRGCLNTFPRFFLHRPECLKESVRRVDEMGCDRHSKMFIHAIRTVGSMTLENWKLKLELFRSLGFSEDDIVSMFRRRPQVFAVSYRKIKEGTILLLSLGKFDIPSLVQYAELLILSIEKRLKPRLEILEVLEKKNLLKKKPNMLTSMKLSDKRFHEKYVLPYSNEVGKIVAEKGS